MSLTNEINMELYRQMVELQEKLRKSEEERMKLEEKFRFLMKSCREEEEIRLRNLQEGYAKFLEDCSRRNDRNDKILRSLEKVESGASILFAKTERLKSLRSHYEAYLERVMPQWKQPSSAIAYKSTYSSSTQQAPIRSSYSSRLMTTTSDHLGNYAAGSIRSTDDNDRILDFIRNRRPFFRDRSFSTTNYSDTLFTRREVVPPPVPEPVTVPAYTEYERKPERVYFRDTKPDDEVVKPIVKQPEVPVVEILPEIETMAIEEKVEIPNEKTYYQEIECLSEKDELPLARKKREVDYVLSDEEIVENIQPEVKSPVPSTPPSVKRDLSTPATPKKEANVGKLAPDVTAKFDAPVTYPRSPSRSSIITKPGEAIIDAEDLSPVTKRSLVEHQKSIEQLKAALSIEEPEVPPEILPNEETDVTESSSEVWQPQQPIEDWQQVQEQAIIPSDVEEIENQFAEIISNQPEQPVEQYYEEQQQEPVYEEQQNEVIDYNEEQYPESYYEQPAQPHYPTNIASNVILEEDEYEEQEYAQEQKPEFEQENYQEQNYEYQQDGEYQQEYQNYQQDNFYDENQQQNFNYDENNQQYQQNYDQNYQQENYPQENYQENNQYQNYENNYQDQDNQQYDQQQYDQNKQQYDQNSQQYDQNGQQYDENNQQYDQNNQQYDQNSQQFDQNNQQYDQNNQQYDQSYTQEGEYPQQFDNNMEPEVPQEGTEYPTEGQNEEYQQSYQEVQDATTLQAKQSNLAHLLESDSESYQIEHGGGGTGNEDSDFDFSLSQKQ